MNFSPRSEYFKTELTTFVGSNSKSKEVKEYSYDVLNTAIDFMSGVSKSRYFGISIPIKYSNFSRFYKKMGPFYKKIRCDKFGN